MSGLLHKDRTNSQDGYMIQWLKDHSFGTKNYEEAPNEDEGNQCLAARLYHFCLRSLQYVYRRERSHGRRDPKCFEDCLGRFYLWGESFEHGELEEALQQSDDLRNSVLEQLIQVGELLCCVIAGASSTTARDTKPFREVQDLRSAIEQAKIVLSSSDWELPVEQHSSKSVNELMLVENHSNSLNIESENQLPINPPGGDPGATGQRRDGSIEEALTIPSAIDTGQNVQRNTEIVSHDDCESYDQSFGWFDGLSDTDSLDMGDDLDFAIGCLIELRPSLESNLMLVKNSHRQHADLPLDHTAFSNPADTYTALVKEKYQQADDRLIKRLGQANWQRHMAVRKLMDNEDAAVEQEDPSSTYLPYLPFRDSGIGTSIPQSGKPGHYTPSHASFISSNAEEDKVSLRVPPLPIGACTGEPFRCFICGGMLTNIHNRVDWKMHVFADLRPYICSFADCEAGITQFSSRAAWADHEFSEHRIEQWWCCPECPVDCNSASEWERHLLQEHQRNFSGPKRNVALGMAYHKCQRPVSREQCLLCLAVLDEPRRAFVKHVGRHMEEIALMALPRDLDDQSAATSDASSNSSHGKPVTLKISNLADSTSQVAKDKEESDVPGARIPSDPRPPDPLKQSFQYQRANPGDSTQILRSASGEDLNTIPRALPSQPAKNFEPATSAFDRHLNNPSIDHGTLAEASRNLPGSNLFSEQNPPTEDRYTSDSFANWLFEEDTVKGFMASQDIAGGRSENRKSLGPSEDYLKGEHHRTSRAPNEAQQGLTQSSIPSDGNSLQSSYDRPSMVQSQHVFKNFAGGEGTVSNLPVYSPYQQSQPPPQPLPSFRSTFGPPPGEPEPLRPMWPDIPWVWDPKTHDLRQLSEVSPLKPQSFQYRRDSSGNIIQVPYEPPDLPPRPHEPASEPQTLEDQRASPMNSLKVELEARRDLPKEMAPTLHQEEHTFEDEDRFLSDYQFFNKD
ncbi:hypothetical protein ACLMJK_002456 [Lecanora helva]